MSKKFTNKKFTVDLSETTKIFTKSVGLGTKTQKHPLQKNKKPGTQQERPVYKVQKNVLISQVKLKYIIFK